MFYIFGDYLLYIVFFFVYGVYNGLSNKTGRHAYMDTKIKHSSGEEYSQLLQSLKNEKNLKQKKRYDTVLFYMKGYSRKQVAEILHIPHQTVCSHITSYQDGGMKVLLLAKQPNAPKKTF